MLMLRNRIVRITAYEECFIYQPEAITGQVNTSLGNKFEVENATAASPKGVKHRSPMADLK